MSWYYSDIQSKWGGALTHEKMLLVTKTSKPYRGSNDTAFPISGYSLMVRFASTTVID
jgi:hypothetical protein